jgi:hypothetical protein
LSPTAFLDTNIPIYAAGAPHPHREPCIEVLSLASGHPRSFITSAEVLQELLHHYRATRQWSSIGRPVFARFSRLMFNRTEPVLAEDARLAAELVDSGLRASSRDLVHVAVMRRLGVERVVSADLDFDGIPGLIRLDPSAVSEWRDSLVAVDGSNGADR